MRFYKHKIRKFMENYHSVLVTNMGEPFNPNYTEVDRFIAGTQYQREDGSVEMSYLVKWCDLSYKDVTWYVAGTRGGGRVLGSNFVFSCPLLSPFFFFHFAGKRGKGERGGGLWMLASGVQ